LNVTCTESA